MNQTTYFFELAHAGGTAAMANILGSKGAGLTEMSRLRIPIPPGFIIPTTVCQEYLCHNGLLLDELAPAMRTALERLEKITGKKFNDPSNPLILSVRSGAELFMPGMMDTIHYVGLNEYTANGLPDRLAQDCLKRLRGKEGISFPQNPFAQLIEAITRVFNSWNSGPAKKYRELNHIPDNLGTACTVQMMVFGNWDEHSGSGVIFSRSPLTGEDKITGEYLFGCPGEDLVSGAKTPCPISKLAEQLPDIFLELQEIAKKLENHYRTVREIEFTVEKSKLWILQDMAAKCSPLAKVRVAVEMAEIGLVTREEAINRVDPEDLPQLHLKQVSRERGRIIAKGIGASPGAVTGRIIFHHNDVPNFEHPLLIRLNPNRDDIQIIEKLAGLVTVKGGAGSHFSVIARNRGIPAVVGCEDQLRLLGDNAEFGGQLFQKGDELTIDGATGEIFLGKVALLEQRPIRHLQTLLNWCDEARTLGIRVFADNAKQAAEAREQGVPIAISTERMFMDGNGNLIEAVILAETVEERAEIYQKMLEIQRQGFEEIFRIMGGTSIIIRLLDPPLSEFLAAPDSIIGDANRLEKVARFRQNNPLFGHRGCRLFATHPELYQLQIRAIFETVEKLDREYRRAPDSTSGYVHPIILIPLVTAVEELERIQKRTVEIFEAVFGNGSECDTGYTLGSMIETPRAALISDKISQRVGLLAFGLMDLSQCVYGASRDDASAFLPAYLEHGIWSNDPFMKIDQEGVGKLMALACKQARAENPGINIEIAAWDSDSIRFVQAMLNGDGGLVCPLPSLPQVRLAAAQAAISTRGRQ